MFFSFYIILFEHLLHSFEGLLHLLDVGAEGDADVARTIAAKDEAGHDEDTGLVEYTLSELLHIVERVGNASPEEHALLSRVKLAFESGHDFFSYLAARSVCLDVGMSVPCLGVVVCLCRSELEWTEGARVDVSLLAGNQATVKFYIIESSGCWWIYAWGPDCSQYPVSVEKESDACYLLLVMIDSFVARYVSAG